MFEQNEQCIELFRRERHFAPFFKKNAFRDVRPENAKFVEVVSLWLAHLSEVFQKNLTEFQGFLKTRFPGQRYRPSLRNPRHYVNPRTI